ncbi:MAG TPA: hypothetical protein VE981_06600 [Planctomycetota bacterium]|nr:hypothetical protein [Planctomycetota bacterium]
MKKALIPIALLMAACGGGSEEDAARDRAAAASTWALAIKLEVIDVRIPVEAMNVLLFKDEEVAKSTPTVFEVQGQGVSLIGEIPPAANPGYDEKWEKLIGVPLTIKSMGDFGRDVVESHLGMAGKLEMKISSGTMTVDSISGKWSGSQGDKTLKGRITLTLQDGRTLQGTFATHALTWG